MFGWWQAASSFASRSRRASRSLSATKASATSLSATSRPRRESWARHTSPIPPAPRRAAIWYEPKRAPGSRPIVQILPPPSCAPGASKVNRPEGASPPSLVLQEERPALREVDRHRLADLAQQLRRHDRKA